MKKLTRTHIDIF